MPRHTVYISIERARCIRLDTMGQARDDDFLTRARAHNVTFERGREPSERQKVNSFSAFLPRCRNITLQWLSSVAREPVTFMCMNCSPRGCIARKTSRPFVTRYHEPREQTTIYLSPRASERPQLCLSSCVPSNFHDNVVILLDTYIHLRRMCLFAPPALP